MKFTQKAKPLIVAIVFTLLAGCGVVWLWFAVEDSGSELFSRLETIKKEQAFESKFKDLEAQIDETKIERESLEMYILNDEDDTIAMLTEFDTIAANHNLELSTDLQVDPTEGSFDFLKLTLKVEGGQVATEKMIRILETLPYHSHINSLSYQRSKDVVSALITMSITIAKDD